MKVLKNIFKKVKKFFLFTDKQEELNKLMREYQIRSLRRKAIEGEVGILYLADDPILEKLEEEIKKLEEELNK
jgi:hypothetical protein